MIFIMPSTTDIVPGPDTHVLTTGVMTALLRSGKTVDSASSIFLLGGLLLIAMKPVAPYAVLALLLLGFLEKYYAWRVTLDAELFALLGKSCNQGRVFDAALAACLVREPPELPRSMEDRWRGARRLLLSQMIVCGLQGIAIVVAVLDLLLRA
jgi:hypothetical protein